jgi:hypothetical protein
MGLEATRFIFNLGVENTMRFSVLVALAPLVSSVCCVVGCGGDDVGTPGSGGSSSSAGPGAGGNHAGAGGSSSGAGGLSGGSDDAGDASDARSSEASNHVDGVSQQDGQDESMSDSSQQDSVAEASIQDGDAAATRPKVCAEICAGDGDCARDTGIQPFRCHPATHHCSTCVDDMICVATRSLWTAKTCTDDPTCVNEGGFAPFGDVCIDIDGTGYCAFLATSTVNCTAFLVTYSTFSVKKYGSSDMVDVCGRPSRCDADRGSCQNPCTSNTSCTPARGGRTCNTGLGRCECASDVDCGPGAPTCNLTIKQCECGSQADCSTDTGRTLTCQ